MSTERPWLPTLLLWLLIILYVVQFGWLSIARHDAFLTHTRDLGNMDQPIWSTLHGRFLEETRGDGRQSTRLTDHFEPIFALISLVFLVWDDVRALLVLQTVALALGALPVYWLAQERFSPLGGPATGRWLGLAFAGAYLLFPALQAANLAEFHASPLAVPLLLFAYYYGRRGEAGWFWGCSLLALMVKEEISLLTFMLGLYLAWKGKPRWWGVVLALLSLAWFGIVTFVIIPAFGRTVYAGAENSIYFARYGDLGSSPREIALNLFRQPAVVLTTLLSFDRLAYLAGLLAPVGFLAIFDLPTALIGLPVLLANLLSNYPAMYSGEMHYSAPLVPFFVAGAIGGASWLVERTARWGQKGQRWAMRAVAGVLLLFSLGCQVSRGYTLLSLAYDPPVVTAHHRLLGRFAAQIPPDAPLSTTPPLFPHFSHRPRIHQFPVVEEAAYVLLDAASTTDMHPNDFYQAYLDLLERGFGIVDAADGYILLQAGLSGRSTLPAEFYSFIRLPAANPQYRYQIDFGEVVRFQGFTLYDDARNRLTRARTYWQVLQAPPDPFRLYPFFLSRENEIIEDTTHRPMPGLVWYPPARWEPGDILQFDTIPWDVGDEFSFCVGVLNGLNWADMGSRLRASVVPGEQPAYLMEDQSWVRLLTFERWPALLGGRLRPVYLSDEARLPNRQLQVTFGDSIELLGYELRGKLAPAGRPTLTLYWRVGRPVDRDYTVFVHLTAEDGTSLPQTDSGPNWRGPLGTTAWPVGQIIPDSRTLILPADAPAGEYRVRVGLYYWQSMERLPAKDKAGLSLGDEVLLTTIHLGK